MYCTHIEPTTDDSQGKAVHVGTAGICMKQSLFTMRKRKCLKVNILNNVHTIHHTHTHTHIYVEIFLSLCSAAISTVSVHLLSKRPDRIGSLGCGPITVHL